METEQVTSEQVFGNKSRTFDSLGNELRAAAELKRMAEEDVKRLYKLLEPYFADNNHKVIHTADGTPVQRVDRQGQWRIDELALLEAGVAADVIKRCKKQDKPSTYYTANDKKAR